MKNGASLAVPRRNTVPGGRGHLSHLFTLEFHQKPEAVVSGNLAPGFSRNHALDCPQQVEAGTGTAPFDLNECPDGTECLKLLKRMDTGSRKHLA